MRKALWDKIKIGFVNGDFPRPTRPTDALLDAWECCHDLVVSWIQNSVSASVKSSMTFVDDVKELWDELQD